MRLVLAAIAVCSLHLPSAQAQERRNERQLFLERSQEQIGNAAKKALPSVACIVVSRSEFYPKAANASNLPGKLGGFNFEEFLKEAKDAGPERDKRKKLARSLDLSNQDTIPDRGYVSGAIVDSSGLVLTPYHGIEGATKIYVFVPGKRGTVGSYADIYAADARSDLAVLKLIDSLEGLQPIATADVRCYDTPGRPRSMFSGKMIGLLTFPYTSRFRLDQPSIALGGISRTNLRLHQDEPPQANTLGSSKNYYEYGTFLEHDVKLNGAVSGAVLIDLEGDMVGLTTTSAVISDRELGPGYAIPMDESVRHIVDTLRKGREVEYGFLGVAPRDGTNSVRTVTPGGPAELAGIWPNDAITHINDIPINSFQDLLLHVGSALAGSKVKLTVYRNGQPLKLTATLAKFIHSEPFIASVRPDPVFGIRVDYLNYQIERKRDAIDGFKASSLTGVSIAEVAPDSAAANKFKALGDNLSNWAITHVDRKSIATPAEFYDACKGRQSVKLTLREWGESTTREVTLP